MTAQAPVCSHWRTERDQDNLLWLYLDRAKENVNSLSSEVLLELDTLLDYIEQSRPDGVAFLSGKTTGFILGADIREFDQFTSEADVTLAIQTAHSIFSRVEALPCPTVAAFEGYCLGGGLELALCCKYRIAKNIPSTKIGFPEIQLGIFPGFGGSARSVYQIGAIKAMELMLSSRQIGATQAKRIGLIDQAISRHKELYWSARAALLSRRKSRGPGIIAKAANLGPFRRLLATQMRKQTAAKAREAHYPAPYRLIDTWEQFGHSKPLMLKEEALAVGKLMVSSQAAGLRHTFHLMERLKKESKKSEQALRRVHIIGAGVMGGDIAAWCALKGLEVSLQDREMAFISPALKRAETLFRKKRLNPSQVKAACSRLRADVNGDRLPMADLVIEVIIEDLEAKQTLFRDIEPLLKPTAILATNTSSIPLERIATALTDPTRLIGLHFFNPVAKMPLIEVVAGQMSSQQALTIGASFCAQISRLALPVKSSPGFLVNRVLAPYMLEAMVLHQEGYCIEQIDAAAESFGMPMGPVELADTVGLDVCSMVMKTLDPPESDNDKTQLAINYVNDLVKRKRLGRKSGRGFYNWKSEKAIKKPVTPDSEQESIISDRLIQRYIQECQLALKDGIVADSDMIDAGMIFGTGFAPFRGGPMYYQNTRQRPS